MCLRFLNPLVVSGYVFVDRSAEFLFYPIQKDQSVLSTGTYSNFCFIHMYKKVPVFNKKSICHDSHEAKFLLPLLTFHFATVLWHEQSLRTLNIYLHCSVVYFFVRYMLQLNLLQSWTSCCKTVWKGTVGLSDLLRHEKVFFYKF